MLSIQINTVRALNFLFFAWRAYERVYVRTNENGQIVLFVKREAAWPVALSNEFTLDAAVGADVALDAETVANALDVPVSFLKDKPAKEDGSKAAGIGIADMGRELFVSLLKLEEAKVDASEVLVFPGGAEA